MTEPDNQLRDAQHDQHAQPVWCLACGYNLAMLESAACPECGTPIPTQQQRAEAAYRRIPALSVWLWCSPLIAIVLAWLIGQAHDGVGGLLLIFGILASVIPAIVGGCWLADRIVRRWSRETPGQRLSARRVFLALLLAIFLLAVQLTLCAGTGRVLEKIRSFPSLMGDGD